MAQPTIQPPPEPSLVDAAAARVGQRLNASWMLDEVLGVGGVAAVFAGTHADGGRAALKVLHASLTREPEIRERFLREGRIADQVDHPGRVRVLGDEVSDQGEPFLILELLAGTTLQRLLRRPGEALPLEQALAVFDAVLDLLERCHAAGIVHRDIKPANIFITSSGQVKVLDFGFARMREEGGRATRVGLTYGTPAFMAPEQAMALGTVDGRADLWSVGACMYAALSGKPVREGRTEAESHLLAATQPARSLARVASQMPLETVAFVDRALAFDRGRRFQTAAEMRAELRGLRAAHAAGRLTAGGQARGPGVVLRANDTVAPPDPREDAAPRVAAFFRQLAVVLSSARQYGWSHPFVGRGLGAALEEVHRALAEDPAGLRWDVVPGAFTVGGQPVWQPDRPPFDRIPYQLFADGLRSIQLKPGITDVELRDFAAILLRDHSFGGDEDSITALWDRRFEHVAYLAVDSFSAGDAQTEAIDEAGLALCRGLARIDRLWIDRLWDEGSLEGRSMQRNLEATARARGFRAGGPPSVTDELTARTLGAQVSIPFEEWRERFMDAFVDGYLEAERRGDTASLLAALTEWTADQIVLHDLTPAFEVHAALRRAFSARAEVSLPLPLIHRAITAAMLPQGALRAILEELADHGPDEPARGEDASYARQAAGLPPPPPPVPPGVAEGLSLALEVEAEGALFTAVCDSYAAVQSDRVREVLLGYLTRWAPGREAELAEILPRAPAPLALTILRLLSGLRTPEAAAALEAALGSQHISVRINALALLPDAGRAEGEPRSRGQASGDRIRDELGRLLEAPDPAARVEALRTIARLGLVAAGPTLVRHIQATSFHERPPEERRQWLDTVVRLNPVRAERLAIDLLERRQLLPSDAIEQTREIAVIVLASFASSEDALAVVKEATKPRWGSSPGVRDAAARAVPAIAARLARRRSAEPASDAGALSRRASTLPPPATVPPPSVPASVRKP